MEDAGHHDIFALKKGEFIDDGSTSAKPTSEFLKAVGGAPTTSGVRVTPDSAMQSSAVNACVRVYAESIATVPLLTHRRLGTGKERAQDHPLYKILHDEPNPWMSSFEWREWMERRRCTHGNGFSLIERNGRGDVTALYPLENVQVLKGTDRLPYYRVSDIAGSPILPHSQVFHLRNQSRNGYVGLSYVGEAMEAVGLAIAMERFGASLFSNGALNRGFFKYGGSIKEEDWPKVSSNLRATYSGMANQNSPGFLDGDWDYKQTSMKADEAQFLESRNYQVEDIARLFRMPGLMIGHADKTATYASAEQFFLSFVVYSFQPVARRWEGALKRSLFTDNESDLYPEFLLDGLLRGDIKSRYAAYAVARQWGWMNVDEIRDRENMNPLPNGTGEVYLEPLNMRDAGSSVDPDENEKKKQNLEIIAQVIRESASQLAAMENDHE